jgi:putative ABC transport system permease protein
VLGALALVEAGLIAAAAFAVGVRRRQRELGLLAAVGASRRQLAGSVLAEGFLTGSLAAVIGAVVGVVICIAMMPFLDDLTGKRNSGLVVDGRNLLAASAIGIVAALIASAFPAWSAARMHVLDALAARRKPPSRARWTFLLGMILVALAVVMLSTGAAIHVNSDPGSDQTLTVVMMMGGAIAGVFGFGAISPWLLERLDAVGRRLPPSGRIAFRDTARARSRNAPIVTAMLAALGATISLAAYVATNEAATAERWQPSLAADQIVVQGDNPVEAGAAAARAVDALAAAPLPAVVPADDPTGGVFASAGGTFDFLVTTLGDDETLVAMGGESARDQFDHGTAVYFVPSARGTHSVTIDQSLANGETRTALIPVTEVVTGINAQTPQILLSVAQANQLGVVAGPVSGAGSGFLIRLRHPVGPADIDNAAQQASAYPNTYADASLQPSDPTTAMRLVLIALSVLFALSVAAIGVALGEAEARSDQRVLVAVGADPGIRRRITAARAGVLALLAGILAVPAGLLPTWGLLLTRPDLSLVIPWMEVAAVVALLPLAAMVGALLLSRATPEWSAFRNART